MRSTGAKTRSLEATPTFLSVCPTRSTGRNAGVTRPMEEPGTSFAIYAGPARSMLPDMAMSEILPLLQHCEKRHFAAGEMIMEQGKRGGQLLVLIEGTVEVLKDDVQVATTAQSAAVFGEMAVLLDGTYTASVRALTPCGFYVVENARAFLETSPRVCLHVCELIARRLDTMNRYLVDVRQQLAGDDHVGLVDGVLATLLHRQPAKRTPPRESTLRHG